MQFSSEEAIVAILQSILTCMQDDELPVKIQASVCLKQFITSQPIAADAIVGYLPQIVEVLLGQLKESENDDLLDVLSKLIELHGEALKPYAVELVAELSRQFFGMLDYDPNSDESQHKVFAASGCLDACRMLVTVFARSGSPEEQSALQPQLVAVVSRVLTDGPMEFVDDILDMATALTQNQITDINWPLFEVRARPTGGRADRPAGIRQAGRHAGRPQACGHAGGPQSGHMLACRPQPGRNYAARQVMLRRWHQNQPCSLTRLRRLAPPLAGDAPGVQPRVL